MRWTFKILSHLFIVRTVETSNVFIVWAIDTTSVFIAQYVEPSTVFLVPTYSYSQFYKV